MSKIPIANSAFRSYVSKNNDKSTENKPYESRNLDTLDRIRDKENMSRDGKKSTSSFSLKNPVPTEEDYARYDADRRFRETARDVRVAQRSAENSARSSMSPLRTTPERLSGGSSDQFYTPGRSSSGTEQFVTPETSKKESSERQYNSRQSNSTEGTPTARTRDLTEREVYSNSLHRQMTDNFERMNKLIHDGRPPREARHEAILESTERSPRRAQRRTVEQMRSTILATRSSSQPPSFENLDTPRAPKTKSSGLESNVEPVVRTSYVDAVVAAHRMHIHYADVTSVEIEKQFTKLEGLKLLQNLANLSKSKESVAPKKRRIEAGSDTQSDFSEWVKESDEITAKKLAKLKEIKLRIHQIRQVKEATHKLLTDVEPFEEDEDDEKILNSMDHWMSVPFTVFDRQTAHLLANLSVKMKTTIKDYKQVSKYINNTYLNRSRRRSSGVLLKPPRNPQQLSEEDQRKVNDYSKLPPPPPTRLVYPNHRETRDTASQVTARLSIDPMTSWVPRPLTIEKLELRGIKCPYSPAPVDRSTATAETPKAAEPEVLEPQEAVEPVEAQEAAVPTIPDAPAAEDVPAPSEPNLQPPESGIPGTPRPPGLPITVDDLNRMLSGIVLQRDVPFKSEVGFPKNPYSPEESYRSGRSSLDPDSARRLSSGIAHYLKKFIQEQEGHEEESSSTTSGEKIIVTLQSPSDKSSSVGWSLADMEYNVYQNELDVHEETQWEHEKEEEELRHLREVGAETPTREIKVEMEDRPPAPEPHTPREDDVSEEVITPDMEKEEDTTLTEEKEEEEAEKVEDVPKQQKEEEKEGEPTVEVEKDDDEKTVTGELDESEGDEIKKFYVQDEFEKSFDEDVRQETVQEVEEVATPVPKEKETEMPTDPPSYEDTMNETADDSGFLLDNRPVPRLKSIFDQVSPPSAPAPPSSSASAPPDNVHLRADTPRLPAEDPLPLGDITNDSTFKELDLEDYCQKEFLFDIGPIMIQNVINLQEQLRGVDWIQAQAIWQPPTFTDLSMDYYDHFDYFDSFAMLLWGGVVELFNEKYAKFGRKMTAAEEKTFEEEVWEMLRSDYGVESKTREWAMDVPLSARLQGRMPFDLEYRFDLRRNLPKEEKQLYKWQQFQMQTIAARYPRKELEEGLNETYVEQKALLARTVLKRELAAYFKEKQDEGAQVAGAHAEEEVNVDEEARGEEEIREEVSSEEASVAAAGAEEDAVGESDV